VFSQNYKFRHKAVPKGYLNAHSRQSLLPIKLKAQAYAKQAYDLTRSLPKGYVKDGTVDYTKYLQNGINNNKNVLFPDLPLLINKTGLTLKSGTTIVFPDKSRLKIE